MTLRATALLCVAAFLSGCFINTEPQPDVTVQRLIALLQSPDSDLRRTAALSLGKIAAPDAAGALIKSLGDRDPLVRRYSAWALGNLGEQAPSHAVLPLMSLLRDPAQETADTAAQAIGEIGDGQDTVEKVLPLVKEGPTSTRRAALLALGWLESPLSYDELVRVLDDNDVEVRQRAVAALGELGDQRAVSAMVKRLEHDPAESVRNEAAYRLGLMGQAGVVPFLKRASVEDGSEIVRRWSRQAIEALSSSAEPGSKI